MTETLVITIEYPMVVRDGWALCVGLIDGQKGRTETFSGKIIAPIAGMRLEVTGEFVDHPKYGHQFKVDTSRICEEQSTIGLYNYLSKADIRGVGPKLVKRIIDTFGDQTIDVIRNDWEKLAEVRGISANKARAIHEGELKRAPLLDLLAFEGITFHKAEQIYEKYKERSVEVVKNDTYQLIYDIDGVGFATADRIALKNGMTAESEKRVAAAITYSLTKAEDDGHCYGTLEDIMNTLTALKISPPVPVNQVPGVLQSEVDNGHIVKDGDCYYRARMFKTEDNVAAMLTELVNKKMRAFPDEVLSAVIKQIELDESRRLGIDFKYEENQVFAAKKGLNKGISVITGGAGTGKTTIVRTIATCASFVFGSEHIRLCAPTGKAAKRMEEATGFPASTIHRMILRNECEYNTLIVCDETSMIDITLAEMLLSFAIRYECSIVFVGDVNQLPPIGPGMFFRDLLNCPHIAKTELTRCHRQAGYIALNADMVNRGCNVKDLIFDHITTRRIHADRDSAPELILEEFLRLSDKYGVDNVCAISPMRKATRAPSAAGAMNPVIRARVNPAQPESGCKFAPGDRVMNLHNDKEEEIYNGDIGIVTKCSAEQNEFDVEIDGETHYFPLSRQEDFDLAYCTTVHKAQGSEYAAIIFTLNADSAFMMNRNLIYTAITRAKKEIVIIGETKALAIAISKTDPKKRRTKLLERLDAYINMLNTYSQVSLFPS